jgi:transcriptional regulator
MLRGADRITLAATDKMRILAHRPERTMYVPAHFKEDRVAVMHDAIRQYGFGTLVTFSGEEMEASHLPLLLDPEPAPLGTVLGHVARANPQWQRVKPGIEALAIFLGPNTYITPSWYPTKQQNGKVVPTWNYLAIHAYGTLSFYDDPVELRAHVARMTDTHESERAAPWALSDAPESFVQGMLRAIVGFKLRITRLEGKWKMSQNRPAQDVAGVLKGLAGEDGEVHEEVAEIVAERQEQN